jgi:putative nucleotidyltransferase with HDIG domain
MERTVATLSRALGARDPYTEGHELRVAALASAIGTGLGLDEADVRLLRLAATVHDIGKIVVPAEFLSKPTQLTENESAMIRVHSQAGYDMLRPAALPQAVLDAVLQHHERLDGSGYPHGLREDEIGQFGRILAVADVAEAMSSHRPYRPTLGVDRALAELEAGRGSRFDPEACDVCFALFRDGGFSFDSVESVARV